jgi:acetolactate synthase-1/2/3 large subunit
VVFALPGQQLDELFNALYHARAHIRLVHPRHEQATAYMANGYALATGKLGVACVVPGPGLLNASAALATGFAQNAPVLCITGQIPSRLIGKGTGQLHEIKSQLGVVVGFTKFQASIDKPEQVPARIARAISAATDGRPGPVVVEIPPDVLQAKAEVNFDHFRITHRYGTPPASALQGIAELVAAAKLPVIYAGSGALGASAELTALAELLGAPVIMSQYGIGAIDSRHPLAHTVISGVELWRQADLAIAVGTRLSLPTAWGHDDKLKVVRIEPEVKFDAPPWMSKMHLLSTAEGALPVLTRVLSGARLASSWQPADLMRVKTAAEDRMAAEMTLSDSYTRAIRAAIPDDGFVCFDITQLGYHAWWGYPTYKPRTLIRSGYMGTLGFAFPTSLGAKVAVPDKPVVCVTGDGGFMFGIQELATAVQEKINLVTVVMNDGGYGNVRRYQDELYRGERIASDLHNPGFAEVARVFGLTAMTAESPEALTTALHNAIQLDRPVLIEAPVGAFPSWQSFIPRRRVRGTAA